MLRYFKNIKMGNVFVICEIEDGKVADVSLELLTQGKSLAKDLNCKLEAVVLGNNIKGIEKHIYPYGVDVVHLGEHKNLEVYTTLPFTAIIVDLFKRNNFV